MDILQRAGLGLEQGPGSFLAPADSAAAGWRVGLARAVRKGHRRAEVWAGTPSRPLHPPEDVARGPSLLGGERRTWQKPELRTVGTIRFLAASPPPTPPPPVRAARAEGIQTICWQNRVPGGGGGEGGRQREKMDKGRPP